MGSIGSLPPPPQAPPTTPKASPQTPSGSASINSVGAAAADSLNKMGWGQMGNAADGYSPELTKTVNDALTTARQEAPAGTSDTAVKAALEASMNQVLGDNTKPRDAVHDLLTNYASPSDAKTSDSDLGKEGKSLKGWKAQDIKGTNGYNADFIASVRRAWQAAGQDARKTEEALRPMLGDNTAAAAAMHDILNLPGGPGSAPVSQESKPAGSWSGVRSFNSYFSNGPNFNIKPGQLGSGG